MRKEKMKWILEIKKEEIERAQGLAQKMKKMISNCKIQISKELEDRTQEVDLMAKVSTSLRKALLGRMTLKMKMTIRRTVMTTMKGTKKEVP
jgi:hypothetical protein